MSSKPVMGEYNQDRERERDWLEYRESLVLIIIIERMYEKTS